MRVRGSATCPNCGIEVNYDEKIPPGRTYGQGCPDCNVGVIAITNKRGLWIITGKKAVSVMAELRESMAGGA